MNYNIKTKQTISTSLQGEGGIKTVTLAFNSQIPLLQYQHDSIPKTSIKSPSFCRLTGY